jgi:ElaB/YqjD/DUF883 family membrane-anchored ribosome-binding protein
MAKKRSVKTELGDLQAELNQSAKAEPAVAAAEAQPQGEVETLLRDLESCLGKAGDEAEELVTRHPLAAVGAAFLLGILAGRMVGR